jgi:transposase-like protein
MGRLKGGKNKKWAKEEKIRIINRSLVDGESPTQVCKDENISRGMYCNWIKRFEEKGIEGLETKSGNPFGGIHNKKNPTEVELLKYENFRLKMENELLKKGLDPERVMRKRKKTKE